jgi:spermidine/putrescine-binding protein
MAVAVGQTGTGFMINTKVFKEKGWATPTSWDDLKDPKFKKLLVIPPINNTYGLYTLMMFARLNGGGEKNIEPGFKVTVLQVPMPTLAQEKRQFVLVVMQMRHMGVWKRGEGRRRVTIGLALELDGADKVLRQP